MQAGSGQAKELATDRQQERPWQAKACLTFPAAEGILIRSYTERGKDGNK